MRWRLLATLALVAHLACHSDGSPPDEAPGGSSGTGAAGAVGGSGGTGGDSGQPATFEYNGALSFAIGGVVTGQRLQISAPILPRTGIIYAPFPTDLDGEKTIAHDASLLFDWLLPACAPLYPTITLAPADRTPLPQTQLATTYHQ